MKQQNTDFFQIVNNFKEHEHIESIPLFENRLKNVPRYTIVIPTYKRALYLKEALDSAIHQDTDLPYEIIVCDNNPERNDETEQLMNKYNHIPNLSYYKNSKNLGMAGNWNRLVELTHSKWFILLHDDDILAPYYIRGISQIILMIPPKVVSIHTSYASQNKFHTDPNSIKYSNYCLIDNLHYYLLAAPTGAAYKTQIVKKLGGWNKAYYPSLDYCFDSLVLSKYRIVKTEMLGVYYRWEINVSLQKETRIGCVCIDREMKEAILKKHFIPKCFRERWLEDNISEMIEIHNLQKTDIPHLNLERFNRRGKLFVKGLINSYLSKLALFYRLK